MAIKEYKLKEEKRKWEGRFVKILPYNGSDQVWKQYVEPWVGYMFKVKSAYLSVNRHIVFLELEGLLGLAFTAYKDVEEVL